MFYVDWALRISSFAILILTLAQFLVKEKGNPTHIVRGKIILGLGLLILVCVTIRGMQNENFNIVYSFHLLIGTLFFIALMLTGVFGYLSLTKEWYIMHHKFSAYATMFLLVVTLVLGIISLFSH
ncbi:MAG TPA: hypothetical protein VJB09_00025 [Candidatus Paceibacterota bacterium]